MEYRNVEFEVWNRKDLFQFYIQRMRIVMSLTVEMDVTPLVTFAKRQGMKFYPLMIWGVSKVVNAHDAFKYGWDPQRKLIQWAPRGWEFYQDGDAVFGGPVCISRPLFEGPREIPGSPGDFGPSATEFFRCILSALGEVSAFRCACV